MATGYPIMLPKGQKDLQRGSALATPFPDAPLPLLVPLLVRPKPAHAMQRKMILVAFMSICNRVRTWDRADCEGSMT